MSTNETTAVEIVKTLPALLQKRELMLSPVMDLELAKSRMKEFQEFVAHYLEESKDGGQDGGDYGAIPGAGKKKVLFKSGGDKLAELYGLYDEYIVEALENFETNLFYYKITCILKSRRDDGPVGTGLGSCSTYESKYRWRDSQRECPKCHAAAIIKGKEEWGGGYICWDKKGGCKAKFKDGDQSIEGQKIGRMENPDILDTVNTVLKMAKKRAKLDAVIAVTRSSGIFTQDLEDLPMPAPKPVVERTVEETPLPPRNTAPVTEPVSGPAQSGGAEESGKEASEAPKSRKPRSPAKPVGDPNDPVMCDKARQDYLRIEFANLLPDNLKPHADKLRKDYLRVKGFVNEKGEGTSTRIPMDSFKTVCAAALNHAKECAAVADKVPMKQGETA